MKKYKKQWLKIMPRKVRKEFLKELEKQRKSSYFKEDYLLTYDRFIFKSFIFVNSAKGKDYWIRESRRKFYLKGLISKCGKKWSIFF